MERKDKIIRTLDAMEHPENFTKEELDALLSDEECVRICRDLLDSREALARRYAKAPDVEAEWQSFKHRQGLCQASKQPKKTSRMLYIGIALSVAASVILFLLLRPSISEEYTVFRADLEAQVISMETKNGVHTLHVPRGMNKLLVLPDSSRVWLNAESSLQYPESFDGMKRREVYLKGEGYFEVTRNEKVPFEVKTKEVNLKVLGTKFNFRNYPDDAEVTVNLLEGKVALHNEIRPMQELYLVPNERMVLDKLTGKMTKSHVKTENASVWINDELFFDEELLEDIAKKLMRSYDVEIEVADSLKNKRFYGSFKIMGNTIDEVLQTIASTNRMKYRHEDEKYILY